MCHWLQVHVWRLTCRLSIWNWASEGRITTQCSEICHCQCRGEWEKETMGMWPKVVPDSSRSIGCGHDNYGGNRYLVTVTGHQISRVSFLQAVLSKKPRENWTLVQAIQVRRCVVFSYWFETTRWSVPILRMPDRPVIYANGHRNTRCWKPITRITSCRFIYIKWPEDENPAKVTLVTKVTSSALCRSMKTSSTTSI